MSANSILIHFTIRSLGDAVAHTAGVISDPEFTEKELDPSSDRVIVVATDGLWEFVDNDETIELQGAPPSRSRRRERRLANCSVGCQSRKQIDKHLRWQPPSPHLAPPG